MKILQVIPYFWPTPHFGGTPVVCQNIAYGITHLGNEVTVLTTDSFSEDKRIKVLSETKDTYNIIRLRNLSNFLAFKLKLPLPIGIISYYQKNLSCYDIVHLHEYRTILNVFACLLKPHNGVKYILHPQGTYDNYGNSRFVKKIFDVFFAGIINSKIDLYLAISEKEKNALMNKGISDKKIMILYDGINKIVEKAPNFKIPELYFLYLGQISKRKGVGCLVEAFHRSELQKKGYKLLIVGRDDQYLGVVKRIVAKYNLSGSVIFHDSVSAGEGRYLLKNARLAIYVTENEAFGLVPLEAAMVGTRCITARDAGVSELLRKYQIAELADFCNTDEILSALLQHANNKTRIPFEKISVLEIECSWKQRSKELLQIYKSLI